jgi:hypothetical protein
MEYYGDLGFPIWVLSLIMNLRGQTSQPYIDQSLDPKLLSVRMHLLHGTPRGGDMTSARQMSSYEAVP